MPRPARYRGMVPRIPEPAVAPASCDAEGVASNEPRSGLPAAFQGTELPRPEQVRRRTVGPTWGRIGHDQALKTILTARCRVRPPPIVPTPYTPLEPKFRSLPLVLLRCALVGIYTFESRLRK